MPLDPSKIQAILFDYGNTLIEFAADQVHHLDQALAQSLLATFGPFDHAAFKHLRLKSFRASYEHPEFRETTIDAMLGSLIEHLYDHTPTLDQMQAIIAAHDAQFVRCVTAPDYLHPLLDRFAARYKLAVVSNYPCAKSIRASLAQTGIADRLQAIVVSGEVGHVKPHPLLFTTALTQLNVAPHNALYVGDNWLGDIQGAKRAGLFAAYTLQFDTLERFDRQVGDHDADLVIDHLTQLERHLL